MGLRGHSPRVMVFALGVCVGSVLCGLGIGAANHWLTPALAQPATADQARGGERDTYWQDSDGDRVLEPAAGYRGIDVQQYYHTPDEMTQFARRKLLRSNNEMHIYCDPSGDDETGEGTKTNPFQSLRRAFKAVPSFVQHDTFIHLADGRYPPAHPVIGNFEVDLGVTFEVVGNSEHPGRVVLPGDFYYSFKVDSASGVDSLQFEGITWEVGVQNYHGLLGFQDCIFRGPDNRDHTFAGYSGINEFFNCTFTDDKDYVTDASGGVKVLVNKCDINVKKAFWTPRYGTGGLAFVKQSPIDKPEFGWMHPDMPVPAMVITGHIVDGQALKRTKAEAAMYTSGEINE